MKLIDKTHGDQCDVSIVLPFRNAGRYLPETLASVAAQSYPHWRIFLVDDGSTDESSGIAAGFQAEYGAHRVNIIRLEGVGAAAARNRATESVQSRYVAFLDADDVWHPQKLAVQITEMKCRQAAFSYTAYQKIDDASQVGSKTFIVPADLSYRRLLAGNPIRCFTVVYDSFKLGKVYMPTIKMRNDLLAWLTVFGKLESAGLNGNGLLPGAIEPLGPDPVISIPQGLGYYRQHGSSLTGNKFRAARYQWRAYREYLKMPMLSTCWFFLLYAVNGVRTHRQR